jgi:hypothetical protein
MKHYVPEDKEERLHQLNEWFTKALFSESVFKDEEWLPIRLNLSKWKSLGYSIIQKDKPNQGEFSIEESALLYSMYNSISEILLFDKEMKFYGFKQQFDKALLYQNYQKDFTNAFIRQGALNQTILPFFRNDAETLYLKFVDNYFIQQIIRERIRI